MLREPGQPIFLLDKVPTVQHSHGHPDTGVGPPARLAARAAPPHRPRSIPPLPQWLVRFALQSRLLFRGQPDRCGGRRGTWKPESRCSCL